MSKKQLKKIFNLEGYVLDETEDIKDQILLHCHLQKKSMRHENETSKTVNQTRMRKIAHSMFEDKKVFIVIKQRRFYFPRHDKKLWGPLPQVKKKQQSSATFKKTL